MVKFVAKVIDFDKPATSWKNMCMKDQEFETWSKKELVDYLSQFPDETPIAWVYDGHPEGIGTSIVNAPKPEFNDDGSIKVVYLVES